MEKRVLIDRWLSFANEPLSIHDEASVSLARQRVRKTGQGIQLGEETVEYAALIVSELAQNQLRYAREGYLSLMPLERDGCKGLEIIAADIGPGIQTPAAAINDEIPSDGRSLHAGLSAVCRIADEVEFDNRLGEGACIVARKFESRPATAFCQPALMGRPFPGERISGDDGILIQSENGFVAAVSDGLGHGPEARTASARSIEVLSGKHEMNIHQLLFALDDQLSSTRGCAMSLLRFDRKSGIMECASVGDVHAHLYNLRSAHFFTPTPLVLGTGQLQKQKVRIEQIRVDPGSILAMFTDGLQTRTNLKGRLEILRQLPIAIADHLIAKNSRPDDDALVLVVRFPA